MVESNAWHGMLAAAVLGFAVTLPTAALSQAAVTLGCHLEPGPTRAVASIIDGQTLRLDDGVELRLIGALAPRADDAGRDGTSPLPWPPETASRAALAEMVAGKSVALAFAGRRADRYGRMLAHLFTHSDGNDVWVQGRMVEEGHARVYSLPESDACLTALLERERIARRANRGLWAHAAYQLRPADRPIELSRYVHTFQIVRGRVERGRSSRGGFSILELASAQNGPTAEGSPQRGAFRVVWRRDVAKSAAIERAERLQGQNILVRGWIEMRAGPEIEIVAGGQIETED